MGESIKQWIRRLSLIKEAIERGNKDIAISTIDKLKSQLEERLKESDGIKS